MPAKRISRSSSDRDHSAAQKCARNLAGCSVVLVPYGKSEDRVYIQALAADYDGTIATDGLVDDATLAALDTLRKTGRRLILVTGRELPDLKRVFSQLKLFERIVVENGALL